MKVIFNLTCITILLFSGCRSTCKIANCRVRMEHRHAEFGDKVINTMPMCKDQNPKVGQYFKDLVKKPKDPSMLEESARTKEILKQNKR